MKILRLASKFMSEKEFSPANKKVLIIEDDKALVKFVTYLLENDGYTVDSSYDGASGIAKVKVFKPDLILLDAMMSVMDGYKVAEYVKSREETKFIPIIMVTAKSQAIDKVKGLNCGIDDYIVKPFDTKELLARIKSLLIKRKDYNKYTEDEKLKTLKEVIGSVNHEINNPLTSIIMTVDSLMIKYDNDEYIQNKLKIIQENSIRIKDIIAKLEAVQKVITKEYHEDANILELNT